MDFKDYYATLGVSKTASEKELKQAYRKLARKHHPDVNQGDKAGADKKIKEINEAYEVLGDPEKRKKYDELGANWRQYEQAGAGGPGGVGFGGQPGGAGTSTRRPARRLPHDDAGGNAGDVRGRRSVLRLLSYVFWRQRRAPRSAEAAPTSPRSSRRAAVPTAPPRLSR